ncbi:cation:proton antiporter [Altericista sp. CCNU0014]|uniref:cation:proton antiporter n=1 Tax=Altericista sp. CCNU0014 TaxID=3082949 RepID=UPI00384D6052
MDTYIISFLIVGLLLLFVTLGSGWISGLPFSYALIYLIVGVLLGPYGIHVVNVRPQAEVIERFAEFTVLISLFSCGLKMSRPLQFRAWNSTIRLIGLLMPICILALAIVGRVFLGLPWGAAILLSAILAPTDPVLASEIQLSDAEDHDELRFGLTSEGGLNDALAFPFVYFGIYLIEDPQWQNWFRQWVLVDIFWAIAAGIVMGILVAQLVTLIHRKLRRLKSANALMEDFIALSMVMITYALTEMVNGYGFVAVFVAGMVVQRNQVTPETYHSQLDFSEQIEKLMEVGIILVLGSSLRVEPMIRFSGEIFLVAVLLIFVIRPVGTWVSTVGSSLQPTRRWLYGWLGIRGLGSIYYLSYAFGKGLSGEVGEEVGWVVYFTVAISIVLHGISATPLMTWYEQKMLRLKKRIFSTRE